MGDENRSVPEAIQAREAGEDLHWGRLVQHYERCFVENGSTPAGVDWPNAADLEARFATQLAVLKGVETGKRPRLLDIGCGPGLLLDYLAAIGVLDKIDYCGVDLSAKMIDAAKVRWPGFDFSVRDICKDPFPDQSFDIAIMNGVLTERLGLAPAEMTRMAQAIVLSAFNAVRAGIAFNVMNKHVDWERDDLFYWEFDSVAAFLKADVTRHFGFRADYGLYEFTAFAWRQPQRPQPLSKTDWWVR